MSLFLALSYWVTLLLVTGAALTFAWLSWRIRQFSLVIGAAVALAVALVIATFPSPGAPALVTILFALAALALAVLGGGPAAAVVLQLATRGSVPSGQHGGIIVAERRPATSAPEMVTREVLRGGLTIGLLERLAVAGSIIAGFPTAIAIIVAIKSVGRFSELDAAEARERFIIGTLVSLIWASACGGLVQLGLS